MDPLIIQTLIGSVVNILAKYIPKRWIPSILRCYTYTLDIYNKMVKQAEKTWSALKASFEEEMYIFFENSSIPIKFIAGSQNPWGFKEQWYYCRDSNQFLQSPFQPLLSTKHTNMSMNCLSASLVLGPTDEYDMTPWLEQLQVSSFESAYPSWDVLVSAWMIYSNENVRLTPNASVKLISLDGDDVIVKLGIYKSREIEEGKASSNKKDSA